MKAAFIHRCTHVLDKEAAIALYEEALGLKVDRLRCYDPFASCAI